MIIGRMNKRVELKEPVKTADGAGGWTTVWTTRATVWAEFRKTELKTAEATGAIVSELIREIGIRYRTDVRKGWRAVYGSNTYVIDHTYDYDRATTILVCREMVK